MAVVNTVFMHQLSPLVEKIENELQHECISTLDAEQRAWDAGAFMLAWSRRQTDEEMTTDERVATLAALLRHRLDSGRTPARTLVIEHALDGLLSGSK